MARREIPSEVLLARLPLFQALDTATLARLAAVTTRHPFKRGEPVFRRGDPVEGMYVVVYGEIKLWGRTPKGAPRLTGMAGPGQCFGEPVMFLERAAVVTAEAASDALLLRIARTAIFNELDSSPSFARAMIVGLSRRVEGLVQELERQALTNGTERFVAYLLHRCDDPGAPFETTLPAAKNAIASQLNLTPEHFSRILQELQQAGLLRVTGRKIAVPQPARLMGAWMRE
ncbi:Crp/Fnr family transcriptional regulator [Diaphorobacter sp.]|uniref:Crp/Fnr family transcriptional regulator n=1 Tax=Diaphorobacter sp. TaxID=1934310 RepID=UPI00289B3804|nr:Crp/Fnr family transcriptional regulator [Diaphorobacter sp.]